VVTTQPMARLLMQEWHGNGQAPYIEFSPRLDHGDALVVEVQTWLKTHYMTSNPFPEMVFHFGLPRGIPERRFRKATGYLPTF
jgi:transcriptional regulator GlxA family with amidase domain